MAKYIVKTPQAAAPGEGKSKRLAAMGKKYVAFVIDIDLFDRWLAKRCATERPNVVFNRMIRQDVERE